MLVIPFVAMGNAFSFGGVGGRTAADMVWILDCERQSLGTVSFRVYRLYIWVSEVAMMSDGEVIGVGVKSGSTNDTARDAKR